MQISHILSKLEDKFKTYIKTISYIFGEKGEFSFISSNKSFNFTFELKIKSINKNNQDVDFCYLFIYNNNLKFTNYHSFLLNSYKELHKEFNINNIIFEIKNLLITMTESLIIIKNIKGIQNKLLNSLLDASKKILNLYQNQYENQNNEISNEFSNELIPIIFHERNMKKKSKNIRSFDLYPSSKNERQFSAYNIIFDVIEYNPITKETKNKKKISIELIFDKKKNSLSYKESEPFIIPILNRLNLNISNINNLILSQDKYPTVKVEFTNYNYIKINPIKKSIDNQFEYYNKKIIGNDELIEKINIKNENNLLVILNMYKIPSFYMKEIPFNIIFTDYLDYSIKEERTIIGIKRKDDLNFKDTDSDIIKIFKTYLEVGNQNKWEIKPPLEELLINKGILFTYEKKIAENRIEEIKEEFIKIYLNNSSEFDFTDIIIENIKKTKYNFYIEDISKSLERNKIKILVNFTNPKIFLSNNEIIILYKQGNRHIQLIINSHINKHEILNLHLNRNDICNIWDIINKKFIELENERSKNDKEIESLLIISVDEKSKRYKNYIEKNKIPIILSYPRIEKILINNNRQSATIITLEKKEQLIIGNTINLIVKENLEIREIRTKIIKLIPNRVQQTEANNIGIISLNFKSIFTNNL